MVSNPNRSQDVDELVAFYQNGTAFERERQFQTFENWLTQSGTELRNINETVDARKQVEATNEELHNLDQEIETFHGETRSPVRGSEMVEVLIRLANGNPDMRQAIRMAADETADTISEELQQEAFRLQRSSLFLHREMVSLRQTLEAMEGENQSLTSPDSGEVRGHAEFLLRSRGLKISDATPDLFEDLKDIKEQIQEQRFRRCSLEAIKSWLWDRDNTIYPNQESPQFDHNDLLVLANTGRTNEVSYSAVHRFIRGLLSQDASPDHLRAVACTLQTAVRRLASNVQRHQYELLFVCYRCQELLISMSQLNDLYEGESAKVAKQGIDLVARPIESVLIAGIEEFVESRLRRVSSNSPALIISEKARLNGRLVPGSTTERTFIDDIAGAIVIDEGVIKRCPKSEVQMEVGKLIFPAWNIVKPILREEEIWVEEHFKEAAEEMIQAAFARFDAAFSQGFNRA